MVFVKLAQLPLRLLRCFRRPYALRRLAANLLANRVGAGKVLVVSAGIDRGEQAEQGLAGFERRLRGLRARRYRRARRAMARRFASIFFRILLSRISWDRRRRRVLRPSMNGENAEQRQN